MKRQLLTMGVLALLLVAGSAYAQTVSLTANVPFDFIVNGKTMPAGPYEISSILDNGNVLHLQNTGSKKRMIILLHPVEAVASPSEGKLVFHRYGDACFLRQIWREGDTTGRELPKSSREAELARAYANQGVTIAAALK